MDLSFSAKPQTLIASVSFHNFHLPSLSRREFLGCGGQLRVRGLRSRKAHGKLGFQILCPRCLIFHESVYEYSVIAIAATVAAFTAMDMVCLSRDRREGSANETEKHFLVGEALRMKHSVSEREDIVSRAPEMVPSTKDHVLVIRDETTLEEPKEPLVSAERELMDNGNISFGQSDSSLGIPVIPVPNCSVNSAKEKLREVGENNYEGIQKHLADESELLVSNCTEDYHGSAKETSNTDKEQLEVESISCFGSLNRKPLNLRPKDSDYGNLSFSLNRVEIMEKAFSRSSVMLDFPDGQVPLMSFNKSFKSKENCCSVDIGRDAKARKENRDLSTFLHPNGGLLKISSNVLTCLRTYDCLLRDARLKDCLDLLESMESKGLLDMDKIRHTRFFNACKSRKAVKEAFRFCRLIKNPTLSTFNMLLSMCANAQDFDGAFQVMILIKEAALKPDCKLYTTLISTCAKCGKVGAMFEVFHEMVNAGVEPNVNTYGSLIDGCARAGQVAKAFGAYGILRSKNVQPDQVVFNSLITACGQPGAVDRAFDVLAEMRSEPKPIDPDHVTIGALMRTCIQAGQAKRAREVYKMLHIYNIKGTPDVYTIAVNSCSLDGDLEFALGIYDDMKKNCVDPDEMFLSTIIDVAGHANNVDAAFAILKDAIDRGLRVGSMSYSSLMGACCNAKNWNKALELYEDIKAIKMLPTVSTLNALVTALCDGDQLTKSVEVLDEMKRAGVRPNVVTYSILIVACEKKDEADLGFLLHSKAKEDGILPNLIMCRCLTGLCLSSYEKACSYGDPIVSFNSGKPQIDSIWTSHAIMVYRETISSGEIPTLEVFSQVLGCLRFPRDTSLRNSFIENLGLNFDASRSSNISSFLHGFGEYDIRSFSVLEEAASLRVVARVSFKENPILLDARKLLIHTVEVYILTILKGLKHRLAAGARLPNIIILLPTERTVVESPKGKRTVYTAGRVGQVVGSLLRRLRLRYQGDESHGKVRINGLTLRRWFKSKLTPSIGGRTGEMIPASARIARGIADQQRRIRRN